VITQIVDVLSFRHSTCNIQSPVPHNKTKSPRFPLGDLSLCHLTEDKLTHRTVSKRGCRQEKIQKGQVRQSQGSTSPICKWICCSHKHQPRRISSFLCAAMPHLSIKGTAPLYPPEGATPQPGFTLARVLSCQGAVNTHLHP
jgi:hypothetical protein